MPELPTDVIEEAERLTRLAREVSDGSECDAYLSRRDDLLDDEAFEARIRSEDSREVLVLHPAEWLDDGTIRPDRIEDTDRAVEIPLTGPGDPDDWQTVKKHNRDVVERVRENHGDLHGDNARALAEFIGNHYARPIESATAAELQEFRTEYYPRNVWPTEEQRDVVDRSIEVVFETVDRRVPEY
ncbi:DUF7108 family protein [Natranaeroarchaeum aerophilus]|uniref:RnhA operon protein n=1 Tax=Natranaeroarchaeum aerophilus TaxID=2917711 RepID=A0AAE3K8B0_9EURY|nr:rnhA operon protein [Natranaeroarchaeum aerophilus]MCL9814799.1 rnhA operon protein [Natranaeroarchaeum aerophilus]